MSACFPKIVSLINSRYEKQRVHILYTKTLNVEGTDLCGANSDRKKKQ